MPAELNEIIYYVVAFVFVIALILIGAKLMKGIGSRSSAKGGAGSFLRGRERRLGVVEAASVDGRRKLILLRRDDVEHLIMTGGPVDVVVETGINAPPDHSHEEASEPPAREEPSRQPFFEKKPADDGQVVIARDDESVAPTYEREET